MIRIVDTTLRDGEQTPGVAFSVEEKMAIAAMLDEAGVHYIEAGSPAMGHGELEAIREINGMGLRASVIMWNRATREDIEKSLSIGARNVHISLPVSDFMIRRKMGYDRNKIIETMASMVALAKSENVEVSVGAEDATRADQSFLKEYIAAAESCGAVRLRYCDTVGVSEPFSLRDNVERLLIGARIPLEIHTHNDFGMATANALAGVKAGATLIDTTITGLGERAGNAPLEEVVMALEVVMEIKTGVNPLMLKKLAEFVARAAGRTLPRSKSIVGTDVFTHESGIHVDGVMKDPRLYEPFDPSLVGACRRIVIGKHSGPKAVKRRLRELGFDLNGFSESCAVEMIRKAAGNRKGGLTDSDILSIASRMFN
ncbi:MAG: homocitrate synthase [Nitrospinae bacterium]|nr:homocitrate synthase [Nitrospinota bacterium]